MIGEVNRDGVDTASLTAEQFEEAGREICEKISHFGDGETGLCMSHLELALREAGVPEKMIPKVEDDSHLAEAGGCMMCNGAGEDKLHALIGDLHKLLPGMPAANDGTYDQEKLAA